MHRRDFFSLDEGMLSKAISKGIGKVMKRGLLAIYGQIKMFSAITDRAPYYSRLVAI